MDTRLLEFAADVVRLTASLGPLLMAVALALLIRSKVHALLIVINLWLFMEVASTLLDPGYRFASLLFERLVASALQIAIGYAGVTLWRHWRVRAESVTVH
jgi:hypothetical protein